MNRKVLVPWDMPEIARAVFRESDIEVVYIYGPKGEVASLEQMVEVIGRIAVLVPRGTQPVPRTLLTANPDLLGVSNYGVGFSNVDLAAATECGLPVTNTPGILTETTADLTWALLMAAARNVPQAHQFVLAGQWKGPLGTAFMGQDIGPGGSKRPKTLGIIGFGRIGQAVMRRSQGFQMNVVAYDPPMKKMIETLPNVEYRELDDLLRESDFITIHSPLTAENHHLIGEREFSLMKGNAVLVNTARGPLVDEQALAEALLARRIAAAGLDVYEEEPKINLTLFALPNVVLLPHIGSATQDTRDGMAIMAATHAIAILRGEKLTNLVNPEVMGMEAYRRKTALYGLQRGT